MGLDLAFIISAFIAGLLTFLAPCTLPLVPAYIGFISGVGAEELKDPTRATFARRKIFINGLFFVLGFSVVFILLGTLAGVIGQGLVPYRAVLARVGGVLIIFFGLFMLGVLKLPFLQADRRLPLPSFLSIGKPSSSLTIGAAFAFGWTPCIGPILGSILLLASTHTTALQGAILLTAFSIGLALPFLFIAFAFSKATQYIERISKYLKWVSIVGGIFLILLGLLLFSNNFGLIISYGYRIFDFFNYDALLQYL